MSPADFSDKSAARLMKEASVAWWWWWWLSPFEREALQIKGGEQRRSERAAIGIS